MRRVLMALQNRGVKIEEVHHHWSVNLEGITAPLQIELQLDIIPAIIIEGQKRQFGFVSEDSENFFIFPQNSALQLSESRSFHATEIDRDVQMGGILPSSRPVKEHRVCRRVKQTWQADIEEKMRHFYMTLSEKDRRRYAAIEALKLGHGGIVYIAQVLGCNRKTTTRGVLEIAALTEESRYELRIRQAGGGRKRYEVSHPEIQSQFLDVLREHTAGNPMDERILWTNLSYRQIVERLRADYQTLVSHGVLQRLLRDNDYRRRKAQKRISFAQAPHRNEQFENIAKLKAQYRQDGNPVISMDSKKKEAIGNLYRDGHLYTQQEIQTYDHDFPSYAKGAFIPHAFYDELYNTGFINIGTSKDTGEFACASIRNWWYKEGKLRYPEATSILIECDGGGSNSSRHYLFKQDLQNLVNKIGIEIRIAHYPPYTSKYNPIEHRLFPHVTRACQGVIFKDIELVKQLMEKTQTKKGLKVVVDIIDQVFQTGRKVVDNFKENMTIQFDNYLSNWNYRAIPNG